MNHHHDHRDRHAGEEALYNVAPEEAPIPPTEQDIREFAYSVWEGRVRDGIAGDALGDWLWAESLLNFLRGVD